MIPLRQTPKTWQATVLAALCNFFLCWWLVSILQKLLSKHNVITEFALFWFRNVQSFLCFKHIISYHALAISAGRDALGCLLSKCCLYVLGSGIWDLQTVHVKINAFRAADFWSCPWDFLSFSIFCAFFCWDWNFWWPRAIL